MMARTGSRHHLTPQRAKVWPKSSSCFSKPISLATSNSPKIPQGGIDQQAGDIVGAIADFALQAVIDAYPEIAHVTEEITIPAFTGIGTAAS